MIERKIERPLLGELSRFLEAHAIDRTIVAISGGADSTALLVALHELGVQILGAHVNHHLRGKESEGDEQFVAGLCERRSIPCEVLDGTLDPETIRHHGIEAAARDIRFSRLKKLRAETGFRWIATAHQRDDQAETILMRLMTGSGLAGLRGIHPVRDDGVIRPMLHARRAEVNEFLRERGIVPRVDSTNADPRFLRNRVRALLRELPESVSENLATIAAQAQAQWRITEALLDEFDVEASADETRFLRWPDDPWLRQALLLRHIRRLDPHSRDVSANDLERLAATQKRTSVTSELELEGNVLRRRRTKAAAPFEIEMKANESRYIEEIDSTISISASPRIRVKTQPFQLPEGANPTFTVRNRRPADRFRPLGMPREKKLKDFLIDRKIAVEVRDRIPLLVWNGEIVWVAGVEVSDRFKVTDPAGERFEVWLERAGASVETEDQEGLHS